MTGPCELCDALQAELASARMEATAIHQDHAACVADPKAAPLECAALFRDAMTRWVIAASNLECHYADHGCPAENVPSNRSSERRKTNHLPIAETLCWN